MIIIIIIIIKSLFNEGNTLSHTFEQTYKLIYNVAFKSIINIYKACKPEKKETLHKHVYNK